jgi:16S rRNA G527 N7-methylase RsmG
MDERMRTWVRELRRFNPRLHLVGPTMLEHIEREVEVTARLLEHLREPAVADIGSGSGLAAFTLKIVHPDTRVWCIERSARKCTFLRHASNAMGLSGIEVLCEDALKSGLSFDAVMLRSFSPLSMLEKACLKVLREGGRLHYLHSSPRPVLHERFRLDGEVSVERGDGTLSLTSFTLIR